jgi:hypothetical protein
MDGELAIIGITRFSVVETPASGAGTLRGATDFEVWRKRIFHPARLRRRFQLFRVLPLPSVAHIAKHYPHFQYVILISDNLPLFWKLLLRFMTRGRPWCRIVTVASGTSSMEARRRAVREFAYGRRHYTFRLDDDDALADGYLSVVLDHARQEGEFVLSCDDGYYVQHSRRGVRVEPRHYPRGAFGLGFFSDDPAGKTIYCLGHHQYVHQEARVVHFGGQRCWLRTTHAGNHSGKRIRHTEPISIDDAVRLLGPEFGYLNLRRALRVV